MAACRGCPLTPRKTKCKHHVESGNCRGSVQHNVNPGRNTHIESPGAIRQNRSCSKTSCEGRHFGFVDGTCREGEVRAGAQIQKFALFGDHNVQSFLLPPPKIHHSFTNSVVYHSTTKKKREQKLYATSLPCPACPPTPSSHSQSFLYRVCSAARLCPLIRSSQNPAPYQPHQPQCCPHTRLSPCWSCRGCLTKMGSTRHTILDFCDAHKAKQRADEPFRV